MSRLAMLATLLGLSLFGCGEGAAEDDPAGDRAAAAGSTMPSDAGGSMAPSPAGPRSPPPPSGAGEGGGSRPFPGSGGGADGGGAGAGGGGNGGAGGPGAHDGTCEAAACEDATDLGQLVGDDEGSTARSARGQGPAWLRVRVTESHAGWVVAAPMFLDASLTSPPGARFELFGYLDREMDRLPCGGTPVAASGSEGRPELLHLTWGEEWLPNDEDDSRTVVLEVRQVGGACPAGEPWSLVVEGYR